MTADGSYTGGLRHRNERIWRQHVAVTDWSVLVEWRKGTPEISGYTLEFFLLIVIMSEWDSLRVVFFFLAGLFQFVE